MLRRLDSCMPKKLLAHKFDPFPAVTLSEFCLFAPAILHTITPRRHKKNRPLCSVRHCQCVSPG